MASTTLITFLLCTSPTVRKVELLGSWDNFNRAYPMELDRRISAGHWRGCHTFTDIICDGGSESRSPGRNGGLKMGGTYWYYYRIDGDEESYNEAEPTTTLCPLLPGQPVNILNVPIALPSAGTHSRDTSTDSTNSEIRTMEPQDKYMNPRTPPRPRLPRLKTSPPLPQYAVNPSSLPIFPMSINATGGNRSVSQPTSAVADRPARLVSKEKEARSVSPPRNRGLRAALKHFASARSGTGEGDRDQSFDTWSDNDLSARSGARLESPWSHSNSTSAVNSALTSPTGIDVDRSVGHLPFRRPDFDMDHQISRPIWSRRTSRTGFREPSPLRNQSNSGSTIEEGTNNGFITLSQLRTLETLEEAFSKQNTPMPFEGIKTGQMPNQMAAGLFNKEKRLPTLPNTPSSILDGELRAMDAQNYIDEEALCSHFSNYTSVAPSAKFAYSTLEKSRFSEWSMETDPFSPASMTSESTFNCENPAEYSPIEGAEAFNTQLPVSVRRSHEPATPTMHEVPEMFSPATCYLGSPRSPSRFSADANHLTVSALDVDDLEGDVDGQPKRRAAMFGSLETLGSFGPCFDGPDLPWQVQASVRTSETSNKAVLLPNHTRKEIDSVNNRQQSFGQSAAMKELMDELSYLGDLIKAGL